MKQNTIEMRVTSEFKVILIRCAETSPYELGLALRGNFFLDSKVCSLLEWCFIISIDTCWDWFQRSYVLITAQKNL